MIGDSFGPDWTREPRTGFRLRRYETGEATYDVAVAIPEGPVPEGGFPLLVVMDGALHFDAVAAAAQALARRPEKTGVGPLVVLGIASGTDWGHDSTRRERELLPDGEGAAALHDLLHARLLPDVAGLAAIDPARRAILGHSFGGLFALDAVARVPAGFSACVAFSPSVWRAPDWAAEVATDGRILIAWGGREPQAEADLPGFVEALGARGAQVARAVLAGEDHGSIVFAALPMALRFVHGVTR